VQRPAPERCSCEQSANPPPAGDTTPSWSGWTAVAYSNLVMTVMTSIDSENRKGCHGLACLDAVTTPADVQHVALCCSHCASDAGPAAEGADTDTMWPSASPTLWPETQFSASGSHSAPGNDTALPTAWLNGPSCRCCAAPVVHQHVRHGYTHCTGRFDRYTTPDEHH
jgi:hypothetical protein